MKSTKHPTSIDDGPPSHLQLLTTTYQNEAVHVFTCCPNVLYLLNAQLKHPILHNNHPNKTSFEIYGPNATTMYTNHHAPQKSKPMPNLFQKVWWYSIQATPNKWPIRHLEKHIFKYGKWHNIAVRGDQTHQLHKWLENSNIDKELSNIFWEKIPLSQRNKELGLLNSAHDNTWVGHENDSYLVEKPIHLILVLYVSHQMQLLGYIYY